MKRLLISALLCLLTLPVFARDVSLAEIRTRYQSKKVMILPSRASGWKEADLLDGNYSVGSSYARSVDIGGQTGTVVSIEDRLFREHDADAFGRPIGAEKLMNPTINIVVQLDNGMLVGNTFPSGLFEKYGLQLVGDAERQEKLVQARLDKLLSKTLYKTGYSRLLDGTLSLEQAAENNTVLTLPDRTVPNLTPLRVLQAKVVPLRNLVLVEVELPNKETRLFASELSEVSADKRFPSETETHMLGISAEPAIPAKFSKRERDAIRKGEIFAGMSEDALLWSWGFPDKSNDWGSNGEQYIYHQHLYVYVKDKTVRNWQELSD